MTSQGKSLLMVPLSLSTSRHRNHHISPMEFLPYTHTQRERGGVQEVGGGGGRVSADHVVARDGNVNVPK